MAKLVKTYENNEIKNELFFNGDVYSYSMVDSEFGKEGNDKCFEAQFKDKYDNANEEIFAALSGLDFGDDDEVEECLSILSKYE